MNFVWCCFGNCLLFLALFVFSDPASCRASEGDLTLEFTFAPGAWSMSKGFSSTEDVIQYGGGVSRVEHAVKPKDGMVFLLTEVAVKKDSKGKASTDLGRMAVVLNDKCYYRTDDVFLANHGIKRLPGHRIQMGAQTGYACFEIPSGSETDDVRLLSDGASRVISLNGVPIHFKNALLDGEGIFFVPAAELAALLCARLSNENAWLEFIFPDGKKMTHMTGTDKYSVGDTVIDGARSFMCGDRPYVQATAVLKAMGAVEGAGGKSADFRFTDLRIAAQKKALDEILQVFEEGEYGLDDPLILQDPFQLSPLSALVMFRTEAETTASVEIAGKDGGPALRHDFGTAGRVHAIPVIGLYPGHVNRVTIQAADMAGVVVKKNLEIRTEPLPGDFSKFDVRTSIPEKMAPGFTFVDCPHLNGNYPFAIDEWGNVRWYFSDKQLNAGIMLAHMRNGNFITGSGMFIPNSYNNLMAAYEITPLGRIAHVYSIYGLHHDVREKENGNLVFMTSKAGRESLNDYIDEVERSTGRVLRSWDLMEIIKLNEYTTRSPYSGGLFNWLHHNAVWLNEKNNEMLVSGRHQDLSLAFDADTEEVKWWFSGSLEKQSDGMEKKRLGLASPGFEYPTSQHALFSLPDGRIMLFDNRNDDITDSEGELLQERLYSRGVVYEIDSDRGEVREAWQFGKGEQSRELYSSFASDVDCLGENHYLLDFGGQYKMENGDNYDHMVTPAKIKFSSIRTSRIVEVKDDEVVFDVLVYGNANSNSYKAERRKLYSGLGEETMR